MTENICIHDCDTFAKITTVKISSEVEIIISHDELTATLFFNDYDLEFIFNTHTAMIINKMINAAFKDLIYYMQLLRNYEVATCQK